jgi:hypothetical protein
MFAIAATTLLSRQSHAEDTDPSVNMAPQVEASHVTEWKLSSQDIFRLQLPEADGPAVGHVRHIRSGRVVNVWDTGSVARQYYSPLVLGSFPKQFVIVPYLEGGGTGYAVIKWGIIEVTKSGSAFADMGLWASWSHAKNQYDFRVSPCLINAGEKVLFEFQYSQTKERATTVIAGTLTLSARGKDGPILIPATLQDAMATVQLLDSSLEVVRNWAKNVIRQCVPEDVGALLARVEPNTDDADRKVIDDSVRNYFAEKGDRP